MLDLGRNIPVIIETIADRRIFVEKHPAAEFRTGFAGTVSQLAIVPEAAKTEIEKDLRVEIEGPVDAAVNGIRRALSADLATDMQPWAGEFWPSVTADALAKGSK